MKIFLSTLFFLLFASFLSSVNGKLVERRRSIEEYHRFWNNRMAKKQRLFTDGMLDDGPSFQFYVGSDYAEYILSLETGFNKIWLIDQSYETTTAYQVKYDAKKSPTSKVIDQYGFGRSGLYALNGVIYEDQVKTYFASWNQQFGSIQGTQEDVQPEIPNDGIIGFAWDPIEDKKNLKSNSSVILKYLEKHEKKVFFVWMWRHLDPLFGVVEQFDVDFGFVSEKRCSSDITYVPLTFDGYYTLLSFQIKGFTFGAFSTKKTYTAKVDTGLSLIFAPSQIYRVIYKKFNPDYDWERHLLTVDCSVAKNASDWVFKIGDKEFVLSPKDYILQYYLPNHKCVLGIENSADFYIEFALGNPFLRRYCQIFDVQNNKLGLSEALHTSPSTVTVPQTTTTTKSPKQ